MAVIAGQPFNAFVQGRQARQQEDYQNTRNALAQSELANMPAENQRRNALLDAQIAGANQTNTQNAAKFAQGNAQDDRTWGYNVALRLTQAKDPNEFGAIADAIASDPRAQRLGIRREMLTPERAQQIVQQAGVGAGVAPVVTKPYNITTQPGPNGSSIVTDGGRFEVVQPRAPTPPKDERLVQIEGPDGKPQYVRESDAVGKPGYVARDKPAAADLKWQREIKSKQPRLLAADRRVERLAAAVEAIGKNVLFDGGPLDQYALAWSKQGQEIAQAKAALTSELTALTRVPGIGSQSDLETRLASLPFPSAEFAPEVNARAIAELKAFMADLKDVYGSAAADIQSSEVQSLVDKYAPK